MALASPILSSSTLQSRKQAHFTSSRKPLTSFVTRSSLSDGLFLAAKHASGVVIGLGSGHAFALAIQYLGQQLQAGALKDVTGIPTCVGSASEAAKAGIPLEQYDDSYKIAVKTNVAIWFSLIPIDLAFDEADIMEEDTLAAIVGRRKLQADDSIITEKVNWLETAEEIDGLFLGDAEVWRRPAVGYTGPLGGDFPLVTKEGHNILDVIFTSPMESLVDKIIDQIDGVVEHGVIFKKPCTVIIASENGLQFVDNTIQMESSNL
ncbi:hypothetical protein RND71_020341 [Anisodus tanguticus]|uniref:ribose-5-phosphate isomerase n=1 Tax=Anisodus tanguticus TaxID=243964 RepID=A0AAE1VHG4_9SOLA|nr:hypothetical protein RND71_020341 [Anisodus tanguticus]